MRILSPSMLSADFGNLERDTILIDQSPAQWIHIDVMDGSFVPNISYGFPVLTAIRKYSDKVMDVHLMIVEPERYIERFIDSGADIVTFHIEASDKPIECTEMIHRKGAQAGISIKPATPVESIADILEHIDIVLIMSVEPGFGGQSFINESLQKISQVREMIDSKDWSGKSKPIIEVDGGISSKNADAIFAAGADAVVAGSSIFKSTDPKVEIEKILGL